MFIRKTVDDPEVGRIIVLFECIGQRFLYLAGKYGKKPWTRDGSGYTSLVCSIQGLEEKLTRTGVHKQGSSFYEKLTEAEATMLLFEIGVNHVPIVSRE